MPSLAIGDLFRVGTGRARYKVTAVRDLPDGRTEITVYGGTVGHLSTRAFVAEEIDVRLVRKDNNVPWRAAVREVGKASMRRKNGRKR